MSLTEGDHRYPCCRDPENLYVAERTENEDAVMVMRRCSVCNRRHFEMQAKPKAFGLTGG